MQLIILIISIILVKLHYIHNLYTINKELSKLKHILINQLGVWCNLCHYCIMAESYCDTAAAVESKQLLASS